MTDKQVEKKFYELLNYANTFDLDHVHLVTWVYVKLTQKQANWLAKEFEIIEFEFNSQDGLRLDVDQWGHPKIDPKLLYELTISVHGSDQHFEKEDRIRKWSLYEATERPVVTGQKLWESLDKALSEGRKEQAAYDAAWDDPATREALDLRKHYYSEKEFSVKLSQLEAEKLAEYMDSEGFRFYFCDKPIVNPELSYYLWVNWQFHHWGFRRRVPPDYPDYDE